MPRITLAFRLSGSQAQHDLIHEFSLHRDVVATPDEVDGSPVVRIETTDSAGATWEVRATVGMFDDRAVELKDQS